MLNKLLTQTVIGTWYNIGGRQDILEAIRPKQNIFFELNPDETKFKRIKSPDFFEVVKFNDGIEIRKTEEPGYGGRNVVIYELWYKGKLIGIK